MWSGIYILKHYIKQTHLKIMTFKVICYSDFLVSEKLGILWYFRFDLCTHFASYSKSEDSSVMPLEYQLFTVF